VSVGWRLARRDLVTHRGLAIGLGLLVAVPLSTTLVLDGYVRAIDEIRRETRPLLVVQAANTIGEISGSRIPADVEHQLRELGVTDPVAEIHAVAGERVDRAVLVRGIEVDRYRDIELFDLVAGRGLEPGDPPRTAMVGSELAARRGLAVGGEVELRGRRLTIVGLMHNGTFADNEAWVPIATAQEILGWGTDVSLFVVPDDGTLEPGAHLAGSLSVAQRGDTPVYSREWLPLLSLLGFAARTLEIGAGIVLGVVLWRLAWLRRRELGILRLVGLPRRTGVAYIASQGVVITVASIVLSVGSALIVARMSASESFGFPVESHVRVGVIVRAVATSLLVLGIGLAVPLVLLNRRRVADLLRRS